MGFIFITSILQIGCSFLKIFLLMCNQRLSGGVAAPGPHILQGTELGFESSVWAQSLQMTYSFSESNFRYWEPSQEFAPT